MVTKKTVYVASDGTEHEFKAHAESWDKIVALYDYIDEHPIYGNCDGCKVYGSELKIWLDDNPRIHITLFPDD